MIKIERELKFLKQKVNDAAGKLLNDDRVQSLCSLIKWFKTEAQKLNEILQDQQTTISNQKGKRAQLNQENEFLEKALKNIMRQNKLNAVNIKRTRQQNDALKKFFKENVQDWSSNI